MKGEARSRRTAARTAGLRVAVLLVVVGIPVLVGRIPRSEDLAHVDEWCDELYAGLAGEIANEIDAVLRGRETACGTTDGPAAVVECVLFRHAGERNPYNRNESAYTHAGELSSVHSLCRVGLAPLGANGVSITQWVRQDLSALRTFSVVVE